MGHGAGPAPTASLSSVSSYHSAVCSAAAPDSLPLPSLVAHSINI